MRRSEDPRIEIQAGFSFSTAGRSVRIQRLIAKGTSCLVYEAVQGEKKCIVKQLYPEGMAHRKELIWTGERMATAKSLQAYRHYCMAKRRFRKAYNLQNKLRGYASMRDAVVENEFFLTKANTCCAISAMNTGCSWDKIHSETPEQILRIGAEIADIIDRLHQHGWLMIDIKDSNFLVEANDDKLCVRIVDFDSMIPHRLAKLYRMYRGSNATAPPELTACIRSMVGCRSDVYSVGAMLLNKLASLSVQAPVDRVFDPRVRQRLSGWSEGRISRLYNVLLRAMDGDPGKRYTTCRELADALRQIQEMD